MLHALNRMEHLGGTAAYIEWYGVSWRIRYIMSNRMVKEVHGCTSLNGMDYFCVYGSSAICL